MRSSLLLGAFALIVYFSGGVLAESKFCEDITTLITDEYSFKPSVVYFERKSQTAKMTCDSEIDGLFELFINDESFGIMNSTSQTIVCYRGNWYTLNKKRSLTLVKDVYCRVHHF